MINYINKKDILTVGHYLGTLMITVGITVLVCLIIVIIYDKNYCLNFFIPSLLSIVVGSVFRKLKPLENITIKHGMLLSSLIWLWAAFITAIVIQLCTHMSFINAYSESMASWSGTGFNFFTGNFFNNPETLPHSIQFLISWDQWVGGLGIIALFVGLLSKKSKNISELYKSEAKNEKISPNIKNSFKKMIIIYSLITIIGILLFESGGMDTFNSICFAFTTISTGGISITNGGMAYYNDYIIIKIVSIFLMIVGATSFLTISQIIKSKGLSLLKDIQFKVMILLIITFSTIIIYLVKDDSPLNTIYFVVSAITTTGASLNDMAVFSSFIKVLLIILMIIGGAANSTAGSIKIIRFIIILKNIYASIIKIISPEDRTVKLKISNHEINNAQIIEANSFFSIYMIMLVIGWLVLLYYKNDPLNSLFEVVSAQGNVGLSTGIISPNLQDPAKILFIIHMWIGRLEIIPFFVLIISSIELIKGKTHKLRKNS